MSELAQTTAVILAGGLGTRLRSVVADRPKVLAEVSGRPFLARLLDQLAAANVATVVLCTGYLSEQVETEFGPSYAGMRLAYSPETEPLGTGGALRAALPAMHSDPVLILNGDSFCKTDLEQLAVSHKSSGADMSLTVTQMPDVSRFGSVTMDDQLRVKSFEEKSAVSGAGWINAGVYLVSQRLLRSIPEHRAVSLERDMFPRWIAERMVAFRSPGPFLDIGTPQSYASAERFFA